MNHEVAPYWPKGQESVPILISLLLQLSARLQKRVLLAPEKDRSRVSTSHIALRKAGIPMVITIGKDLQLILIMGAMRREQIP